MSDDTLPRPLGGEPFCEIDDKHGGTITLTYNDMWMLIVCRSSMDGDWIRLREAAGMVADPVHKKTIVDRLWQLEQHLDGLPMLSDEVTRLNLHRAHLWFNERMVSDQKNTS